MTTIYSKEVLPGSKSGSKSTRTMILTYQFDESDSSALEVIYNVLFDRILTNTSILDSFNRGNYNNIGEHNYGE